MNLNLINNNYILDNNYTVDMTKEYENKCFIDSLMDDLPNSEDLIFSLFVKAYSYLNKFPLYAYLEFEKILNIDPKNEEAFTNIAFLFAEQNNSEEFYIFCQELEKKNPEVFYQLQKIAENSLKEAIKTSSKTKIHEAKFFYHVIFEYIKNNFFLLLENGIDKEVISDLPLKYKFSSLVETFVNNICEEEILNFQPKNLENLKEIFFLFLLKFDDYKIFYKFCEKAEKNFPTIFDQLKNLKEDVLKELEDMINEIENISFTKNFLCSALYKKAITFILFHRTLFQHEKNNSTFVDKIKNKIIQEKFDRILCKMKEL